MDGQRARHNRTCFRQAYKNEIHSLNKNIEPDNFNDLKVNPGSLQSDGTSALLRISRKNFMYRIYLAIRRGFHLSRMTTNNLISSM